MTMVIRNARLMTCDPERPGLGMIDRGAVVMEGARIVWVGPDNEAPAGEATVINADGRLVTPGLVDCHTHAIFAGDRAGEFAMRAAGKGYLEIAEAGGGINATLGPTRGAGHAKLLGILMTRLERMRDGGTTSVEVKSGYDLTTEGELALLRTVKTVAALESPRVVPTLLAHLVPPERKADRDVFVREICEQWIPRAAAEQLATSVDVWCDTGAFTVDETRAIIGAAKAAAFGVRGHVGQLGDVGAAELMAEAGALSVDHVELISDAAIAALARAGTVAVMLPGACVQLRLPVPPVEKLRRAGVAMAVATDLNPGTSYCETLPIQMWLATTHYGMTVEEAWLGVTRVAARALRVEAGALVAGARADCVIWSCERPEEVPYRYGTNLVSRVICGGA
ncbi:MAG: imidazolonepropionase [Deltaproteobacteria bacterium]|nr:imidazolonepropionase [Deltaproteobacteria bacterium]